MIHRQHGRASRARSGRRTLCPLVEPLEARLALATATGLASSGPLRSHVALPASLGPGPAPAHVGDGFAPMFDGKSTDGWFLPFDWGKAVAKGNEIVLSGSRTFFLVNQKVYKDFIIEGDALLPGDGKGGIQFRSHFTRNALWGYQAAIDTGDRDWAGGLWYQGRGWLAHPPHRAPVHPGRWNHYRVEAIGPHIRIFVNGVQTVDLYDSVDAEGFIALQDHQSNGGVVHYRNFFIKDLSAG